MPREMTLVKFYERVQQTAKNLPNWRVGQCLFNELYNVAPDISERIRATQADPFHSDSVHDVSYMRAIAVIEALW